MKKILFVLFTLPLLTFAQNDSLAVKRINDIRNLFLDYDYQEFFKPDTSFDLLKSISNFHQQNDVIDRSVYLEKRAEQLRRDLGLVVVANYQENFNVNPINDIEENISYVRRAQVGVQWDIADGGLLENRARAKMTSDRVAREKLRYEIAKEEQFFLKRFDVTVLTFNQLRIEMLQKNFEELKTQYAITQDLVFLNKANKERLLKIEIELSEVESLISLYKNYGEFVQVESDTNFLTEPIIPLIDLNYQYILELLGVQMDSLTQPDEFYPYFSWYHRVGLRPYVRLNNYDMIEGTNRNYFSGGISLTIPLSYSTKLDNEVEHEQWRFDNAQFERDQIKQQEEVLNAMYDFRYHLKQFMDHYQKRKLTFERLRIERARIKLVGSYADPYSGLALYNDLLNLNLRLIDDLQEIYLNALKIHSLFPNTPIQELVHAAKPEDFIKFIAHKEKSIYVWNKTFEEFNNDFIREYLIYNDFKSIIISANASDTILNKKNYMRSASINGELYLMLGSNKLFYHQDIGSYMTRVQNNYPETKITGFHLDIEPHTFEEWDTESDKLLQTYLSLVEKASEFCLKNELKLQISVPKHYDEVVMNQLFKLVDEVYFMCYENVDTDFLVRKLEKYATKYPNQVVIALRTEDFKNRIEMEEKANVLQQKLSVSKFAYHDLSRIISLDKSGLK
jgi:hypothetical protein